jgi:hypothetical protein
MTLAVEFVSSIVSFAVTWMLLASSGVVLSLIIVQVGIGEALQGSSGVSRVQWLWFVFLLTFAVAFCLVFFVTRAILSSVMTRKKSE